MRESPASLFIVPCDLARDRALRSSHKPDTTRIWTWHDFWKEVAGTTPGAPRILSASTKRAVLHEAIEIVSARRGLGPLEKVIGLPGILRRLDRRMNEWGMQERKSGEICEDRTEAVEQAIYEAYRDLCIGHQLADHAWFAHWCSRIVRDTPPNWFKTLEAVAIAGPVPETRAEARTLQACLDLLPFVIITWPSHFGSETPEEVGSLVEQGFQILLLPSDQNRPKGLLAVEKELFVNGPNSTGPRSLAGLSVIGAPQGDVMARTVAAQVAARLAGGAEPNDIVVVVPHSDGFERRVIDLLNDWKIPSRLHGVKHLSTDSVIALIRKLIRWPIDDYTASELISIWRNSLIQPDWPEASLPDSLASAAGEIRQTRVFRGKEALKTCLDSPRTSSNSLRGKEILSRFFTLIEETTHEGTWESLTLAFKHLLIALGLKFDPENPNSSLTQLDAALIRQGEVQGIILGAGRIWTWGEFVAQVESIIGLHAWSPEVETDKVTVVAIDQFRGAAAPHLIVAGLGEGTFPRRLSVDQDDGGAWIAQEEQRFLDLIGSAEQEICLIYPTRKSDGTELLPAGFVDEMIRWIEASQAHTIHTKIGKIHPALIDLTHAPLAQSPADLRVRTVGQALEAPVGLDESKAARNLKELVRDPAHRAAFIGTNIALKLQDERTRQIGFGKYEGQLGDDTIRDLLRRELGPTYQFSASQIETYNLCPFQFFAKYILILKPLNERDEFETDRGALGSTIHKALETVERRLRLPNQDGNLDIEPIRINDMLRAAIRSEEEQLSPVLEGLRVIELNQLDKIMDEYVKQRIEYLRKKGAGTTPIAFERKFGGNSEFPPLEIVREDQHVWIQGSIDRIDFLESEGLARIIDYKSGTVPSLKQVLKQLQVQLPIYALAVERLNLAGSIDKLDYGYWEIKKNGFRLLNLGTWNEIVAWVEDLILSQVNSIRNGRFEVNPRHPECEWNCDFAAICGIAQVRRTGKVGDGHEALELQK